MDQISRPAEMQRVMPEWVIGAGPDNRRELGSFGTDRGRRIPGRICLLPGHARPAERRRLAELSEPDGEGFNPVAAGREVKQPVLREVDDNPLPRRFGQYVEGGYDQPAPRSRRKLIDPGVCRCQPGIPRTEF